MDEATRRILLVVDGSYQAYETARYVSEVLPPEGTEIVLLHIASKVPEAFWDLERDPIWQQKVQTVRGWEIQQAKKIADFMERARQVFRNAGFPDKAVKQDVRERKEGIARDIGAESRMGYDSIVMGRRGLSTIKDLSLGSVASKIVIRVSGPSVWLIGGRPEPDKILVGMDSSAGSMLAVQHLSKTVNARGKSILLLHAVRKTALEMEGLTDSVIDEFQDERMQRAAREIEPVFQSAVEKLLAAGFGSESVRTRAVTGVTTRAGAILDEAKAGGYGTIVVGRRGLSCIEEFEMGRVCNKLVQTAKDRALLIVG